MNRELEIRKISLETLIESENSETPSHILLKNVLDKYDYFSNLEKAIISKLVKGVIERRIELDYVIDSYSKTKSAKMKQVIRIILESAVYQILYMDVYDTVAVDMAVTLAKKKGFAPLSGFVNGVLRTIQRQKNDIPMPLPGDSDYLSVKYSFPQNIVDLLTKQYGDEKTEKILASSLTDSGVSFRFKRSVSKERRSEIIEDMKKDGVEIVMSKDFDNVFKTNGTGNISELAAMKSGEITVQDLSSVIMCENVPFGEKILDACAAPGGKSMYLSEMYPDAQITACDISTDKLVKMNDNFKRLRLSNITSVKADASEFREDFFEKYDVVLADVPCSGLGVVGKKQDIKYRLKDSDFEYLVDLQLKIIKNVSKYVKPGGYLCFSTCTINQNENKAILDEFMKDGNFSLVPLKTYPKNREEDSKKGYLQLLQGYDETDGFFIAVLKKND